MAKYIDREEFIQHIEESDLPDMAKRAVIALVRHMPAADVVEVVHGEWVQKDLFARYHWMFNCSCCGNPVYDWAKPFNYCPNCGADMRRDTNG